MLILALLIPIPVSALELNAPSVPDSGSPYMPEDTTSFGEGFTDILQSAFLSLRPDLKEAVKTAVSVVTAVLAIGILGMLSENTGLSLHMAGTLFVAGTLLFSTNSMVHLGTETITEMTEYGKLLYPVMTTALAAQGGFTASASLYAGSAAFLTVLSSLVSRLLLPMVYVFLALATANSAMDDAFLKRPKGVIKTFVSWCLKTLLTIFTTYLSITGIVSGTTDAATLKAAKVTISSFVPVVGSILSDASESVLVSASLAKNAAGVYGLLAVLAVFIGPFFKIGVHYLILKLTTAICELMGPKNLTALVEDFSSAMGLILAMTGSVCLILMISTICYLKGAL